MVGLLIKGIHAMLSVSGGTSVKHVCLLGPCGKRKSVLFAYRGPWFGEWAQEPSEDKIECVRTIK